MRQLAIYLTRVQPAKLNITWAVTRSSSLLLARIGSRIFLASESRNPHGVALRYVASSLSRSALLTRSLCLLHSFVHVNVDHRIVAFPLSLLNVRTDARDILRPSIHDSS